MISPQPFGPYELIERINVGGMAEVFRAYDRAHARIVAIKRILPSVAEDDEFIQMFRDEAAIASQLDHPNIAKIFDVGKVDLSYYLALEFVSGKDLRVVFERAVRSREPLPLDFVVHIAGEICKGLEYAHLRVDARGKPLGLVHRDVSPQNVLVSFDADVKIIDFGIAKAAGKLTRTQVGTIKGKFGYMSPEQVRGLPIDRRSDVFSLGICLWELLALERLFSGDNEIAIMEKIRACDIPPLLDKRPDLPAELSRIVLMALAKDVDERYATAADLNADLDAFARAQGLDLGRPRTSEYMRRVFAGDPALTQALEEKSFMAERKDGSDLDVFEGLGKKSPPAADEAPTPFAPRTSSNVGAPAPVARHKTLLGMPAANLPPPGFPVTPGKSLPPPPRGSVPPPMPGAGRATSSAFPLAPKPRAGSLPAPPKTRSATPPPLPSQSTAPPGPRPGSGPEVDMDWDEDDEKTTVFEKDAVAAAANPAATQKLATNVPGIPAPPNAARTLMGTGASIKPPPAAMPNPFVPRGTGSFAPPPPPGAPFSPHAPPPMMGRTTVSNRGSVHLPPSRGSLPAPPPVPREVGRATTMSMRAPRQRRSPTLLVVVALLGVAVLFVFFAVPRTGTVKVFVAGANMEPLEKFWVLVDGIQKCSGAPCTLDLDKGIHAIKAGGEGFIAQEQGKTVAAGEEAALNFKLAKASSGTGLRATGKQDGVELFVDGKEAGPLPQELKDLSPGPHKVRFRGSDRYAQDERTINVNADEITDLGAISLKVLRGLATFDLRTPGAKVTLVSGRERRQLTDFSQPVEIETSKNWTIEATKAGHDEFKQPIVFEERAERTFVIDLPEKSKPAPIAVVVPPTPVHRGGGGERVAVAAPEPEPEPAPAAEPKPAAAAGGPCTLNFNSIPVSNVILDGRPLGGTPRLGVTASAGPHNVVFVTAEEGRKSRSFTCKSGETQTVAVRLSQ